MKLSRRTIPRLAEFVCGAHGSMGGFDHSNFQYRSSWYLTQFFQDCRLPYEHDDSTRISWVRGVLEELNNGYASDPDLPSDDLITVIIELLTSVELDKPEKHQGALEDVNRLLAKDNLQVSYFQGKYSITKLDKIVKTVQPVVLNEELEVMSNQDDVKKIIAGYNRRLQKLKEQKAAFGLHTPPHILIEIEDINAELVKLRAELKPPGESGNAKPTAT